MNAYFEDVEAFCPDLYKRNIGRGGGGGGGRPVAQEVSN